MRVASSAIICIVFLLSLVTSAQTYSIRVNFRTNLRATHSLEGRIITAVPADTVLHVIGSMEEWLKISRNNREVWMANWVGFTRVDSQPAMTSDINNCCFVDRLCQADHEWVSGYWAYQNNQCGAPQVSVPSTISTVVDLPQSEVNNCCQIGWQCHSDHDWQTGHHAFLIDQCAHQGVEIAGSPIFIDLMEDALDLLKSRTPHWYVYAIQGLRKIREVDTNTIRVWAHSGETRFGLGHLTGYNTSYISSIAALLVHEACHVHRGQVGQQTGDVVGERACTEIEIQVLRSLPESAGRISHLQTVLANIEDRAYQWWH